MNLYRSFGNLLELWVAEAEERSDSDPAGDNEDSPAPSSDAGAHWCGSLDSGVEAGTSCSTDAAERDSDELSPASASQSPFLSSSPRLRPGAAPQGPNHRVEQALERIKSKSLRGKPEADEAPRRRPSSSSPPKRHSSELVRGQRSQNLHPRWTVDPSVSERWRGKPGSEDVCGERRQQLSPGLLYLEQLCQRLEELARQHMQNRASQTETAALQERLGPQDLQTWSDSEDAEEKPSSCPRLENTPHAENSSVRNPYTHFRARSASDSTIATLHKRKLSADCRGQHLSTYDLSLEAEREQNKLESIVEETDKPKKSWKFRIGSLRGDASSKSQHTQPPERNSTRRRLSQLFRRRRTILPQ
ncbi:uncharacterized protein si:dkey-106l3.7 isoform X2 [Betta splendens]|uniref:Uncharacterized protein si:dkey-106l3.7 isoform X2 n=1 Tax=Betta splendens TaxID=158456 RepID=A0A6P7P5N0_BETSP|nr:uncharacterized protein si:dkey-106l3.7 isoform X2 [Betta splendens]